jgi:diacylglycerol kinase
VSAYLNLGIGLAALTGGLAMLFVALKRHKRDHRAKDPGAVAMLIAGMMVTAFGLFITAFAISFASPVESAR